jgi:predicted nucleotidyltransferase component of viral defense system
MIGEKIMACNRRRGGSAKDVYDLFLWSQRPFDEVLVRRMAVLKAWTDQRRQPLYTPQQFLDAVTPRNYRWDVDRRCRRATSCRTETLQGGAAVRLWSA